MWHLICCKVLVCEMWYIFAIHYPHRMVRNSSVGFPLYSSFFLLQLYNLLIEGLLVWVKGNGASFAANYSPELHFSSVCMNQTSSTKVRVKLWNVTSYLFLTGIQTFYIYVSPLRLQQSMHQYAGIVCECARATHTYNN